jgi:hypothetical protein
LLRSVDFERVCLAVRWGESSLGGYWCGHWLADAHISPVVPKLFAAVQADNIGRVALTGGLRKPGFPQGRDGERRPTVRASQEHIQ